MAATASTAVPTPPPPAPRRRRRRWPWVLLAAVLVLLAALAGAAAWALSPAGLAWWLPRAGVQASGLEGGLLGGPLRAASLRWARNGAELEIDELRWADLRWAWRPHAGAWLGLTLQAPQAARVAWRSGPPAPEPPQQPPAQAPTNLKLPLHLRLADARVGTLQVDALAPVRELRLDAELGADGGRVHRVNTLSLQWERLQARLSAQVQAEAPLALQGKLDAGALPGTEPAWQTHATLSGNVAQPALQATLRSGPAGADVSAQLAPFEAWPLRSLQARTQALDLSALAAGLPATALSGQATVQGGAGGTPLRAQLQFDNARPGPWSAARLPLRTLQAVVAGEPSQRDRVALESFTLELGDDRASAGTVSGHGRWQGDALTLALQAQRLQPARLDARLPPLRLEGPLTLSAQGLPLPGTLAPAAPPALAATLEAALRGTHEERMPVQLNLAAQARREGDPAQPRWQVELQRLQARAGAAQARAQAQATLEPGGAWRVRSDGTLERFDPRPWWPAAPARTVLDARWDAQLSAAAGAALPAGLRGQAQAQLAGRLADVPLQGRLDWRDAGAGLQAHADLRLADNRVDVEARAAHAQALPALRLEANAPALAQLAPLASLHPALAAWWPSEGRLRAQATLQGSSARDARTQGTLETTALALGPWKLGQAQARWNLQAPALGDAPLALSLEAAGLQQAGAARLDRLNLQLDGRWSAHRLALDASSPLRLPAWADGITGPSTGTELSLRGTGAWQGALAGNWTLQLQTLQARTRGRNEAVWLRASPFEARLKLDPALRSASLSPGGVQMLGASLRWEQLLWEAPATAGAPPRLLAQAQLQALRVAPWLARFQPGFGWEGDLEIDGRVQLDSARAQADVVLQRLRGDLRRRDEVGAVQDFGMSDLRLALQLEGGRWTVTQALAARQFGVLAGAQVVTLAPGQFWPTGREPLQGVLELRVDNLGVWAPWVPAGWRLGGQLHAGASFGGRVGAPEVTGRLDGQKLAVRNLLQGVDVRDGELAVALTGDQARIERFVLRAGEGSARITGGAQLGEQPSVALQLQASRFQALGRFDRRVLVSGQAALALRGERLQLDGRLAVDEGLIDISQSEAPALDSDVVVVNRPGAPPVPAGSNEGKAPPTLLAQAQVNLRLDLGQQLRLRGRGIDTRLGGELALTTPNGEPQVRGTVRTLQGRYAAYGQAMDIERGEIVFTGPVANPRLDILAVRPKLEDVRVGVLITGTAQSPRVRLFSDPEMADLDKLSWLVMGKAPDALGRTDTALLQRAALALLAGPNGGGGSPGGGLFKRLGLDDVGLRRQADGSDVAQTVVALGRQISSRWYLGYERGLGTTLGTWQLTYRLARRFTVRASTGASNALDMLWSWRWN